MSHLPALIEARDASRDLAFSALPDAPVVRAAPRRPSIRRSTARVLRWVLGRLEPFDQLEPQPAT